LTLQQSPEVSIFDIGVDPEPVAVGRYLYTWVGVWNPTDIGQHIIAKVYRDETLIGYADYYLGAKEAVRFETIWLLDY